LKDWKITNSQEAAEVAEVAEKAEEAAVTPTAKEPLKEKRKTQHNLNPHHPLYHKEGDTYDIIE